MRREELYLKDIVQAADEIAEFIGSSAYDHFLGNNMLRSAVLQKLMIIGEAAAHVTKKLRERHPEIIWSDVVAFRNLAIHAYFSIDWSIVWQAAIKDAPELRAIISHILAEEYSGNE